MPLRDPRATSRRLLAGGLALALAAVASGALVELWRFGTSSATAASHAEQQVRRSFDRMTTVLTRVAVGVAMDPAAAQAISGAPDAARELFELVDRRLAEAGTVPDTVAVTVYDKTGVALAWVGRPADAPNQDRLTGPSAFFVAPSALGLRLVHILPILGAEERHRFDVAALLVARDVAQEALAPRTVGQCSRGESGQCAFAGHRQRVESRDLGVRHIAVVARKQLVAAIA